MIKSHYPMIGENAAKKITYFATKIIHLVRNPFDNLASRYMGENRKFKGRFNALTRAVAKGETTSVFENFLTKDIEGYVHFHEYVDDPPPPPPPIPPHTHRDLVLLER